MVQTYYYLVPKLEMGNINMMEEFNGNKTIQHNEMTPIGKYSG